MTSAARKSLLIYGGGGHGLVVAEAAEISNWLVAGFVDDKMRDDQTVGKWAVVALASVDKSVGVIVAIGENLVRGRVYGRVKNQGFQLQTVIHPTAWVSPSAHIGSGVYIGPHAVVNARAHISDGAIINSAAVIEHHCHIGEFAHIAPNAALGGNTEVGKHALVGLGASVRPGTRVGEHCTIGVGAAVVRDVPDGKTVAGVPAKSL